MLKNEFIDNKNVMISVWSKWYIKNIDLKGCMNMRGFICKGKFICKII